MPANPGQKRAQEKKKKKRAVAQQTRRVLNAKASERVLEVPVDADAEAPGEEVHPYVGELDYDDLDARGAEIDKLLKKKKWEEAEAKSRDLARLFPGHSDGLVRLAKVHEARGALNLALTELRNAALRPNEGDDEVKQQIAAEIQRVEGMIAKTR